MLDAYIIDAIRREELERERAFERSRLYIELEIPRSPDPRRAPEPVPEQDTYNSVVIPLITPSGIEEDAA